VIEETDDGLVLRSVEELIEATYGMFKNTGGKSMTEELLEDRRREVQIEEAEYRRWVARTKATRNGGKRRSA
jgi:hypothetical protein